MNNKFMACVFAAALAIGSLYSIETVPASEPAGAIVLRSTNTVSIVGVIDDQSVAEAQKNLAKLLDRRANQNYKIYLVLDTPGGDVQAGLRLYEFLKPYTGIDVLALNAASMGAVLLQLNSGKRLMTETGVIMFHRMSLGLSPATMDHIISRVNDSKALELQLERKIARRIGMSHDEFRARSNEEWYVRSEEAIDLHIVDEIVSVRCSAELVKKEVTKQYTIFPGLPPLEVVKSECPLL